jgi:two-component system LytT family response regulator
VTPPPPAVQLRVIVVDDEAPGRDRLLQLLGDDPEVLVLAACEGGQQAIAAITLHRPDVVFLDIRMPEVDGFAVIEGVTEALDPRYVPRFVFVTAYDEHAVKAFEVNALDYLLKPFDRARFAQALGKAKTAARRLRYPERLLVRDGDRIHVVHLRDVDRLESAANFVTLHVGKVTYLYRSTLAALEEALNPEQFERIHRQHMVQKDRVRIIHRAPDGQFRLLELRDGTMLPVGRDYKPPREWL